MQALAWDFEVVELRSGWVAAVAAQRVQSSHSLCHHIGAAVGTFVDTGRLVRGNFDRTGRNVVQRAVGTAVEAAWMERRLRLVVEPEVGYADGNTEAVGRTVGIEKTAVEEQHIVEVADRIHCRSDSRSQTTGCCSHPSWHRQGRGRGCRALRALTAALLTKRVLTQGQVDLK